MGIRRDGRLADRLVGQLAVLELEIELAIAQRRIGRQNISAPAGRAPVTNFLAAAICGHRLGQAAAHQRPGLRVAPARTFRLDHQSGIEPGLLVGRRTEVIVSKDGPHGPVFAQIVEQRIGVPALHGGLRALPLLVRAVRRIHRIGAVPEERDRLNGQLCLVAIAGRGEILIRIKPAGVVDEAEQILNFLGGQRAVFVVEAVGRAIGRKDVELHEVDVLTQHVGWRTDLKVVELVVVRHQIGEPVLDDLATVGAEEQRFGRALIVKRIGDVAPQRGDPLLREMPALLVEHDVELDVRGLVLADGLHGISLQIDARLGERGSAHRRQPVEREAGRRAVRRISRVASLCVCSHARLLGRRAGLRQLHDDRQIVVLGEVPPVVLFVEDVVAHGQMARQTAVEV